jgi:hypothetical protein
MALPKGMECPPQVNPSILFSLDEYDQSIFDSIPKGIQAIIEKSPEYVKAISGKTNPPDDNVYTNDEPEDIPF